MLLSAVLAVAALVHAGALGGGFVWDDIPLIERQPAVIELRPLGEYFGRTFWSNPEYAQSAAYYRPLVTLSYALEWRLWEGQPMFFHATNVLAHLAACALVFALAQRAGATAPTAGLAALLFAVFPRGTESVSWISGRTDVLAALGALAAWLLHRSEPERLAHRTAAAACVGLGLFCKEVALAGAAALAALEWVAWRAGRAPARRALANLAPLAYALAVYGAARAWASHVGGPEAGPAAAAPLAERPLLALQALGRYTAMLADPLRPRLLIGVPQAISRPWVTLGAASAIALGLGAWRLARRGRADEVAAAALALAALAPVLHLLPAPISTVAADRYLYLPVAGLAVLGASAARALSPRAARAAAAASLALAVAAGVATARRAAVWADELALWRAAVAAALRENDAAPAGLGEALLRRDRCEEALAAFAEAERRRAASSASRGDAVAAPDYIGGNTALCLAQLGRFDEALARLEVVVRASPETALHRFNLALLRAQRLELDLAERELDAALALYPGYPRALELRRALGEARAERAALAPPAPDEPTATRAARARLYARVGNGFAARALWAQVLAAPDASPADVRRAAVYLVLHGPHEDARRAVERLAALPGMTAEARALEQALAARLLEEGATG